MVAHGRFGGVRIMGGYGIDNGVMLLQRMLCPPGDQDHAVLKAHMIGS
jgi:hypothetical protein